MVRAASRASFASFLRPMSYSTCPRDRPELRKKERKNQRNVQERRKLHGVRVRVGSGRWETCGGRRESRGERQSQSRQTDTRTAGEQTDRQTEQNRQTGRQTHVQTDRCIDRGTERQRETERDRHTDTERQRDRETE
eukprot:1480629-Rhodomonas_salina.1